MKRKDENYPDDTSKQDYPQMQKELDMLDLQKYLGNYSYLRAMNLDMIAVNIQSHRKQGIITDHLLTLYRICKLLSNEMEKLIHQDRFSCCIENLSECIIGGENTIITFNEHRIKSFEPERYIHEFIAVESQIFNS